MEEPPPTPEMDSGAAIEDHGRDHEGHAETKREQQPGSVPLLIGGLRHERPQPIAMRR